MGTYEIWLASVEGADHPGRLTDDADPVALAARLDAVAPRWLGFVRDVERRRAWGDRLVDALCDPPESFVLGSVLAHVLTYSAQRRGLARALLRQAGVAGGRPGASGRAAESRAATATPSNGCGGADHAARRRARTAVLNLTCW